MPQLLSPVWRRFLRSLAYAAFGALLVGVGYLVAGRGTSDSGSRGGRQAAPLVELARFSSMTEKRAAGNRLRIAFRIRSNQAPAHECYVYVVTRNDEETPPLWSVWPPRTPGRPPAASRHLRVDDPTSGHHVVLSETWVQITASIDQPPGQAPFDKVIVYVVEPGGKTILARPFAL
jgi:hypothetical protein